MFRPGPKLLIVTLGVTLLSAAISSRGQAAVIAMDIDDLTRGSSLIVRARVETRSVSWTPDASMLHSTFVLAVSEVLKGSTLNLEAPMTVVIPGGQRDGLIIRNGEAADLSLGGEVLLFLRRGPDGRHRIFGCFQGKFTILNGHQVRELRAENYEMLRARILDAKRK